MEVRKKILFVALLACLHLTAVCQSVVPFSVQQFLEEQAIRSSRPSAQAFSFMYVSPRVIDGREMVDAFIAIRDESVIHALQREGVLVNCTFDGFVTAQIPLDALLRVSRLSGVTDVEISRRAELCTDSTLSVTHAGQVINGLQYGLPQGYNGSGVIVGIIDKGFDFQHRAFRRSDDSRSTRIVRVYNTEDDSGHPANYNKTNRLPGSVFMGNEILSLTTDCSGNTHGTHTASIAAGSHVYGYGGMAPGADIVMCAIAQNEGKGVSVVELANCVRYIDSYADSVGKPCVMSLSISVPGGQHDGNDYFSKAVAQTTGVGRIFVISSGNMGGDPNYAHKKVSPSNPINLLFYSESDADADSSYKYTQTLSEIWMRNAWKRFYYKFHIFDRNERRIVWESDQYNDSCRIYANEIKGYYKSMSTLDTTGLIKARRKTSSDGRRYVLSVTLENLICQSYTIVNGMKKSRYVIGISLWPQSDAVCDVDAWASNSYAGFGTYNGIVRKPDGSVTSRYYTAGNDSCSILTYAVESSIISAGAYAARNSHYSYFQQTEVTDDYTIGDIAPFSSYQLPGAGPTGEALPTICAPGVDVVAAGSRYSYFASGHDDTVFKGADGSWWGVMSGTSMSSPTVAGIIALWLQANPQLTPAKVKDILARTAIRDEFTMGAHGGRFGPNGKIDALAGMRLVLADMGYGAGDVDCSGVVNIDDLTWLIDYLLGKTHEGFSVIGADVNADGKIDIDDLSALIDMLLGL